MNLEDLSKNIQQAKEGIEKREENHSIDADENVEKIKTELQRKKEHIETFAWTDEKDLLKGDIKHLQAFTDYCLGKSKKEIAQKFGVSVSTVNMWSSKEKWRNEKEFKKAIRLKQANQRHEEQRKQDEKIDNIYDQWREKAEESITSIMDTLRISARILLEEQIKRYNEKKAKEKSGDVEKIKHSVDLREQRLINNMIKDIAQAMRHLIPEDQKKIMTQEDFHKSLSDAISELDQQVNFSPRNNIFN